MKVKITLKRSLIGQKPKARETVRSLGLKKINSSGLNIFVSSKSYNQIEIIHHLFILLTIDLCIGKKNYPVS